MIIDKDKLMKALDEQISFNYWCGRCLGGVFRRIQASAKEINLRPYFDEAIKIFEAREKKEIGLIEWEAPLTLEDTNAL